MSYAPQPASGFRFLKLGEYLNGAPKPVKNEDAEVFGAEPADPGDIKVVSGKEETTKNAGAKPAGGGKTKEVGKETLPNPINDVLNDLTQDSGEIKEEDAALPINKARKVDKHMKYGDAFFARHDYTNGLLEYETVIKTDPENYKAHFMAGKVLMQCLISRKR